MPTPPYILRGGRVVCHGAVRPENVDIHVDRDGRIAAIGPALSVPALPSVDAGGSLVVAGLVDAHQHLDKALTRRAVGNPDGTLPGAIAAYRNYARTMTASDLADRAGRTIERCLAMGTVAIRTHANVDPELESRAVEALVEVREAYRRRITLQVVAFVTAEATRDIPRAAEWLEAAIKLGADVVGGTPAISDKPLEFLDMLFAAAERHALPIDLHLDEHLSAERQLCEAVAQRTRAYGMQGRVVASHCSVLSAMAPDDARRVMEAFREAGIGVITLPAANLFLQGREADRLAPRGLTRVRELLALGVPVAAASDNIEDPFVPVGTGDMLEAARWMLLAAGLGTDQLALAFDMVTRTPAELMGLDGDYGIRVGARADLLLAEAADAEDLVARGAARRQVLVAGREVAAAREKGI